MTVSKKTVIAPSDITTCDELLREIMVVVTLEAAAWQEKAPTFIEAPPLLTSGNLVELVNEARSRAALGHEAAQQFVGRMDKAVATDPGQWGTDDRARYTTALFKLYGRAAVGSFRLEPPATTPPTASYYGDKIRLRL